MDLSTKPGRREQGLRIQTAVDRAGLSIEELAGRIGCSRALIYQYLSGSTLAQPDRLQHIAAECGVSLSFFYQDAEETTPPSPDETSASSERIHSALLAESPDVTARLNQTLKSLTELADAQEAPPNYRSLAATCERIFFLAGQLGDRSTQAEVQFRLGNAYLRSAQFTQAADALKEAIDIAVETRNFTTEADARQSLGNVLISLGRLPEAREQFTRIAAGSQPAGRWKGTLSLGSVHTMFGEYREAMARFDDAASILEEGEIAGTFTAKEAAVGLLYVNGNRTNVYLNGGDFAGAKPIIEKCLETAEAYGIADEHLEARFDLAWCDFNTGKWTAAHRGLLSMMQLARFVGDLGRETMARAWLGILLAAAGDFSSSISYGKDALSAALSRGDRRGELYAQLALADAYTGQTNRESEARYHANQALAVATSLRMERGEAECRLRLARLAAQMGEEAELSEAASRARSIAEHLGARHLECLALCWQAHSLITKNDLDAAEAQADTAYLLAQSIGLTEGAIRSLTLKAEIAQRKNSLSPTIEEYLRLAIDSSEALRAQLVEAGMEDTLLENSETTAIYEALVKFLQQSGEDAAARSVVETSGWPPLADRFGY